MKLCESCASSPRFSSCQTTNIFISARKYQRQQALQPAHVGRRIMLHFRDRHRKLSFVFLGILPRIRTSESNRPLSTSLLVMSGNVSVPWYVFTKAASLEASSPCSQPPKTVVGTQKDNTKYESRTRSYIPQAERQSAANLRTWPNPGRRGKTSRTIVQLGRLRLKSQHQRAPRLIYVVSSV